MLVFKTCAAFLIPEILYFIVQLRQRNLQANKWTWKWKCEVKVALDSAQPSAVCWTLCFYKASSAGSGSGMTCQDLDYRGGSNRGWACHFGAILGQTAGDTQTNSLVWSGLTVCFPSMSAFPDNSAWHTQMSTHKQSDTRPVFTMQRWAHVQRRRADGDEEWHLSGNQCTQTQECLQWYRLSVFGQRKKNRQQGWNGPRI